MIGKEEQAADIQTVSPGPAKPVHMDMHLDVKVLSAEMLDLRLKDLAGLCLTKKQRAH